MKKPSISLAALERIDAGPFLRALEVYQKAAGEISAARVRETKLKQEIDDFLATVDPDNEKAMQAVGAKRMQLEIIPNLISRVERTIHEKLLPSAEKEFDALKERLVRFYVEARESYAKQLAEMLRPFYSDTTHAGDRVDRALDIAKESDDCLKLAYREQDASQITRPASRRLDTLEIDGRALCEAAESLLSLAKQD